MDSVYVASIYRITASNFRISAEILAQNIEFDKNGKPKKITAIPLYFLVSHAAELFLKSALLKRGVSEQELKKFDYRHNLKKLLDLVLSKQVPVTDKTIYLLEYLDDQHKRHALRYTALMDDGKKTYLPPIDKLFEMLDELLLLTKLSHIS